MYRRWRRLAALTLGAVLMVSADIPLSLSQPVLVLSDEEPSVLAGTYLSLLRDDRQAWSIHEIVDTPLAQTFEPSSASVPSVGYSRSSYWLRVRVTRHRAATDDWFLSLTNKSLDHVDLYIPDGEGGYVAHTTGDAHPFRTRKIPERHFVFPITVPDTVIVLHLRLESNGPLYFPIYFQSAAGLLDDTRSASFQVGALFGILIVIALFHLVFYLTIRDATYLIYVGFLAALVLYNLSVERFAFQYLWPENIWLAGRSHSMLALFCAIMTIEFTRAFLDTRQVTPGWDRALQIVALGCLLLFALFLTDVNLPLGLFTSLYFMIAVLLVVLASIAGIRRRQPAAKVFLAAWSFLLAGTVVSVLGNLSVLPPEHVAGARGAQIGSTITVTLFALALGQRLNSMIRAREELRLRIANDLHDDIGAGLTQIVMASYLLRRSTASSQHSSIARDIETQARALSDSMRDVVWTVSPTKESWQDVEDRLHDIAARLLIPAGIRADLQGEYRGNGRVLPLDVRQNVLHIFKECAHNATKHSRCSRFEVRWQVDRKRVWMRLSDDGIGFEPGETVWGHGIQSLQRRVEATGNLNIYSAPGEGTTIEFEVPLL